MNRPEPQSQAEQLKERGFVAVEPIEPEALDVSAAMLANPRDKATARMRKNIWALRDRVFPSRYPMALRYCRGTWPIKYVYATRAVLSDDVKLERRLSGRNARQLMKLRNRSMKRALRCEEFASDAKDPKRQMFLRQRASELHAVGVAAKWELMERRHEGPYKNPDGN